MKQLYGSGFRDVWTVLEVEGSCTAYANVRGKVIADGLSEAEMKRLMAKAETPTEVYSGSES